VTNVADKHQWATQSYVRRPYGVGLLVAGFDVSGSNSTDDGLQHSNPRCSARVPICFRRHRLAITTPGAALRWERARSQQKRSSKSTPMNYKSVCSNCSDMMNHCLFVAAVGPEELLRMAVRALHTCTEADKELTPENTVLGIVRRVEQQYHCSLLLCKILAGWARHALPHHRG
jgi:hypothetical protein